MALAHRTWVTLAGFLLLLPGVVRAQQVAIRHYTVDDGLPNDTVGHAFQDSQGYLWFSTAEGLSRFDGYRFINYTVSHGLGANVVHQTSEETNGNLWVATNGGLSRLNETAGPVTFTNSLLTGSHKPVFSFGVAPDNRIWCVQNDGIYVAAPSATPQFVRVRAHASPTVFPVIFRDRRRQLWFSHDGTLFEVQGTSLIDHRDSSHSEPITGIAERPDGSLLIARKNALFQFDQRAQAADEWLPIATDLPQVTALLADSRGHVWLGTPLGLARFDTASARAVPVRGTSGNVADIVEDRDGNLWISSHDRGVFKVAAELIVSYTATDGLSDPNVASIVEGDGGRIYVITQRGGTFQVEDNRLILVEGSTTYPFTTIRRRLVHDGQGRWWMWTDAGAFRIDGRLDFRRAVRVTDAGDPFPTDVDGPSLYVDQRGDTWIATADRRLLQSAGDSANISEAAQWSGNLVAAGRIARTAGGVVWLGMRTQLARLTGDRLEAITQTTGLTDTGARALFIDSRGWLWVGTAAGGVSVTETPEAPTPVFRNYSTNEGLSSAWISSIAEDRSGRIYLVTGKGLDRLDPRTGHIKRITRADGLVESKATYCMRDSRGYMWVGTTNGVSRMLVSDPQTLRAAPPVRISRVQIGEREIPLPPRGSRAPLTLQLDGSSDSVQIEYVALNFLGENALRYRFRLDGAADAWTGPTESRSVIYGNLAPGSYAFRVSAIGPEGDIGPETSALAFTVPPPMWLRWWFLLGIATATAVIALWLHRFRIRQILATERVRRQVSHDLHDDLGAGLVHIAAMAELAVVDPTAGPRVLGDIKTQARSLRDSMSDIVWAVDPSRDHFVDVIQRMKDAAYAMLEADGIVVEFRAPHGGAIDRMVMTTEYRRHVLLVLKEAVANIVRHAAASNVSIEITKHGKEFRLVITDDGIGFHTPADRRGNGLESMRRRAAALGGTLDVQSAPDRGTTVTLTLFL